MAWSRFKQQTREIVGKADNVTELPNDIVRLSAKANDLLSAYNEAITNSELCVLTPALVTRGTPQPYAAMAQSWLTLADTAATGSDVTPEVTQASHFVRESAQLLQQMARLKSQMDEKIYDSYVTSLKAHIRLCEDGKQQVERLKQKRVALDGKKYRLLHDKDSTHRRHNEESVSQAQEKFDNVSDQVRNVLAPLDSSQHCQHWANMIASCMEAMQRFHRECAQLLSNADTQLHFHGRATQNAGKEQDSHLKMAQQTVSELSLNQLDNADSTEYNSANSSAISSVQQSPQPFRKPTNANTAPVLPPSNQPAPNQRKISSLTAQQGQTGDPYAIHQPMNPVTSTELSQRIASLQKQTVTNPAPVLATRPAAAPPVLAPKPKLAVPTPTPTITATAMYPFEGVEANDLPFQVGDVITVENQDGQWWTGSLKGRRGTFPSNYVQLN